MAQQATQEQAKKIIESTFAEIVKSRHMPVGNCLNELLSQVTGTVFKLEGGSTEQVQDPNNEDKQIDRAVYDVQTLNSKLLPLGTKLQIKIKGEKCILSEEDMMNLVFNKTLVTVVFDEIQRWSFNSQEGLNATGIHFLQLTPEQIMSLRNRRG